MSEGTKILAGTESNGFFAEVRGRATHVQAHVFRKQAFEMIDGGCRVFEIDLASCASMDSTFLGVLASIGMRLQSIGGSLTLFNAGPQCADALKTLGVHRFVQIAESRAASSRAWPTSLTPLPDGGTSGDWSNTMLEAHELLADIDTDGPGKWDALVSMLRADIERKKNGPR